MVYKDNLSCQKYNFVQSKSLFIWKILIYNKFKQKFITKNELGCLKETF